MSTKEKKSYIENCESNRSLNVLGVNALDEIARENIRIKQLNEEEEKERNQQRIRELEQNKREKSSNGKRYKRKKYVPVTSDPVDSDSDLYDVAERELNMLNGPVTVSDEERDEVLGRASNEDNDGSEDDDDDDSDDEDRSIVASDDDDQRDNNSSSQSVDQLGKLATVAVKRTKQIASVESSKRDSKVTTDFLHAKYDAVLKNFLLISHLLIEKTSIKQLPEGAVINVAIDRYKQYQQRSSVAVNIDAQLDKIMYIIMSSSDKYLDNMNHFIHNLPSHAKARIEDLFIQRDELERNMNAIINACLVELRHINSVVTQEKQNCLVLSSENCIDNVIDVIVKHMVIVNDLKSNVFLPLDETIASYITRSIEAMQESDREQCVQYIQKTKVDPTLVWHGNCFTWKTTIGKSSLRSNKHLVLLCNVPRCTFFDHLESDIHAEQDMGLVSMTDMFKYRLLDLTTQSCKGKNTFKFEVKKELFLDESDADTMEIMNGLPSCMLWTSYRYLLVIDIALKQLLLSRTSYDLSGTEDRIPVTDTFRYIHFDVEKEEFIYRFSRENLLDLFPEHMANVIHREMSKIYDQKHKSYPSINFARLLVFLAYSYMQIDDKGIIHGYITPTNMKRLIVFFTLIGIGCESFFDKPMDIFDQIRKTICDPSFGHFSCGWVEEDKIVYQWIPQYEDFEQYDKKRYTFSSTFHETLHGLQANLLDYLGNKVLRDNVWWLLPQEIKEKWKGPIEKEVETQDSITRVATGNVYTSSIEELCHNHDKLFEFFIVTVDELGDVFYQNAQKIHTDKSSYAIRTEFWGYNQRAETHEDKWVLSDSRSNLFDRRDNILESVTDNEKPILLKPLTILNWDMVPETTAVRKGNKHTRSESEANSASSSRGTSPTPPVEVASPGRGRGRGRGNKCTRSESEASSASSPRGTSPTPLVEVASRGRGRGRGNKCTRSESEASSASSSRGTSPTPPVEVASPGCGRGRGRGCGRGRGRGRGRGSSASIGHVSLPLAATTEENGTRLKRTRTPPTLFNARPASRKK